jgi:hypothetical protein
MSPRRASVLAVYAHPDDELFHGGGMLAHLAERGAQLVTFDPHGGYYHLRDPPPEQARRLNGFAPIMQHEVFTLGGTRGPVPQWPLRDFFDGLEVERVAFS